MRRQLDPKIFPASEYIQSSSKSEVDTNVKANSTRNLNFQNSSLDFQEQEEANTQSLRERISGMKDQQDKEKMKNSMHDLVQRIQQLELRFAKFAEPVVEAQHNLRDKMQALEIKVSDRALVDNRTQALIDRHQIILRQFEQDMQKMRSLVEEKEMQNAYLNNMLRDARLEIERLKKL